MNQILPKRVAIATKANRFIYNKKAQYPYCAFLFFHVAPICINNYTLNPLKNAEASVNKNRKIVDYLL